MNDQQKIGQRDVSDQIYTHTKRTHLVNVVPFVDGVVRWRLRKSINVVRRALGKRLTTDSPILFVCAGEGGEASWLCDMGFSNVTFSDLSPVAVSNGLNRDSRLKGLVLDAENLSTPDNFFDIVIAQDGLHHLPSPTRGFTEMLRVGRLGALFIEPHNSLSGRAFGTKWERSGNVVNYVFRWNRRLVEDVASSFLGPAVFENHSFSYWHHTLLFYKIGQNLGFGRFAEALIASLKWILDSIAARNGNQFSGIIIKK